MMGVESLSYLQCVLAFIVTMFVFEAWVETRQLRELKKRNARQELSSFVTKKEFKAARAYGLDRWYFSFLRDAFAVAESVAFLSYGGLAGLWHLSGDLNSSLPFTWDEEIQTSCIFLFVYSVATTVMQQPFSIYSQFVIEERHGFNKSSAWIYVSDLLKGGLLLVALGTPLVTALVVILRRAGDHIAIFLFLFLLGFNLVMLTLYPTVIAPLFNKYDPLEEGPLKQKIESLAAKVGFPLRKVFVMDASKRSGHSNAYMYGFGKNKRIVLFDTLLNQCGSEEEIVAILAHELGHWKLRHTPILFASSMAVLLLQLSLFQWISVSRARSGALFEDFGFGASGASGGRPHLMGLILFQFILTPVDVAIEFLTNVLSRAFEFQADHYAAAECGYAGDLRAGLIRIHKENKSAMNIDRVYSTLHYSHPPLLERIRAIDAAGGKTKEN